mmetsp:Transcript_35988/g.103408  ORF Transcript_35988/g.103408 Transcript_35988/m.103408 type:complete len:394 (-) Transcript_35988:827-2008(-)
MLLLLLLPRREPSTRAPATVWKRRYTSARLSTSAALSLLPLAGMMSFDSAHMSAMRRPGGREGRADAERVSRALARSWTSSSRWVAGTRGSEDARGRALASAYVSRESCAPSKRSSCETTPVTNISNIGVSSARPVLLITWERPISFSGDSLIAPSPLIASMMLVCAMSGRTRAACRTPLPTKARARSTSWSADGGGRKACVDGDGDGARRMSVCSAQYLISCRAFHFCECRAGRTRAVRTTIEKSCTLPCSSLRRNSRRTSFRAASSVSSPSHLPATRASAIARSRSMGAVRVGLLDGTGHLTSRAVNRACLGCTALTSVIAHSRLQRACGDIRLAITLSLILDRKEAAAGGVEGPPSTHAAASLEPASHHLRLFCSVLSIISSQLAPCTLL